MFFISVEEEEKCFELLKYNQCVKELTPEEKIAIQNEGTHFVLNHPIKTKIYKFLGFVIKCLIGIFSSITFDLFYSFWLRFLMGLYKTFSPSKKFIIYYTATIEGKKQLCALRKPLKDEEGNIIEDVDINLDDFLFESDDYAKYTPMIKKLAFLRIFSIKED